MNITTDQKGNHVVIRFSQSDPRELFVNQLGSVIRNSMVIGQRNFAIAFDPGVTDENIKLSILNQCNDIVSRYGGQLAFLESDVRPSPFFRFMCETCDIRCCSNEEDLIEATI